MSDNVNIALGPEQHMNYTLDVLRGSDIAGDITKQVDLLPGLFLSIDPALQPSGRYTSPAGRLLELDIAFGNPSDSWAALHFRLGDIDLTRAGIFGFACRSAAPEMTVIRPCLRSSDPTPWSPNHFTDCFFDKHILVGPDTSHHLDVMPLAQRGNIPLHTEWRELVLFLPQKSFVWALEDLRLFIV